jgi:hypothetical protein
VPPPAAAAALADTFGQFEAFLEAKWARLLEQAGVTPEGLRSAALLGPLSTHAGMMLVCKTEAVGPAVHASPAAVVLSDQLVDAVWCLALQGSYNGATTIKLHALPANGDASSVLGALVLPQQAQPGIQRVALSGAELATRIVPRGSWLWLEVESAPSATLPPGAPAGVTARAQLVTVAVTWDAPANPRAR